MARPKAKAPARRYHISGQSIVTLDGRDFYLGPHDSPESIARYAVLIGLYQKHGLKLPESFDVACLDEIAASLMGIVAPAATPQATGPILVDISIRAIHVSASLRWGCRDYRKSLERSDRKRLKSHRPQ
jgi:hypothetical protein